MKRGGKFAPRVFVSYVRDDSVIIGQACGELQARGVEVWRDIDRLVAGDLWLDRIREQIRTCDYFLAFFSSAYNARQRTVMTEELTQAVDEIRHREGRWFVPILLSGAVPDWYIGRGLTLHSFHWIDFSQLPWPAAIAQLLSAIGINEPDTQPLDLSRLREYLSSVAGKRRWKQRLRLLPEARGRTLQKALRVCRVPHGDTVLALIDCYDGAMSWRNGKSAIVFTTAGIYYGSDYVSGHMTYDLCRSYKFSVRIEHTDGPRPEFRTTDYYVRFPDVDLFLRTTLFGPSADWVVSVLNGLRSVL